MSIIYRSFAKFLAKNNLWSFFYILLCLVLGKRKESFGKGILAINTKRFRGDLEILEENGYTVYRLPFHWQQRLLLFYSSYDYKLRNFTRNKMLDSKRNEQVKFLYKVLSKIVFRYNIGCVIGSSIYYKQDYDYLIATKKVGIPYVVLNRENLVIKEHTKKYTIDIVKSCSKNKYKPSAIFFHNTVVLEIYKENGYSNIDLYSYGAIRMKNFYNKYIINDNYYRKKSARKKIVLFSFFPCEGLRGVCTKEHGFYNLFSNVHNSLYELAIDYPDIDFVIKAKWGGNLVKQIISILPVSELPDNLEIIADCDVHTLMLDADIVSGFNSTTMMEAAALGIPVVYPVFNESNMIEYFKYLLYSDIRKCFNIAMSKEDFKYNLISLIDKYDGIKHKCAIKAFQKYIYSGESDKFIYKLTKYC
jgi:hypothetical protein